MKNLNFKVLQNKGFGLLEVVLAIAVFAFGMLALVQLQTNMARSGADANSRTVAANLAEDLIERARGFTQMAADADNGRMDFNEIVNMTDTKPRGGLNYTVNLIVDEYYWDAGSESFTETKPVGIVNSDIKRMDIAVVWRPLEDGESFENHDSIDYEAGGALRIIETISSAPGLLGALVSASKQNDGGPLVEYNPGENPDIVKILLSEDGTEKKFKEATSPTPDVKRNKKETWFDVVTYSQANGDDTAIFLRREEFVAISCECDLETNPADADQGLKPTLWNGVAYTEGAKVDKPIGKAPNNVQQSGFCSVCCRDHHDGAGSTKEDVYNTRRYSSSDHPHHSVDDDGVSAEPVGDGERYAEACRLVRKDGFMRVTQDVYQGTLIGFPEGYLEFDDGATAYSNYVIEAVNDYYDPSGSNQGSFEQPNPPDDTSSHVFPARDPLDGTDLPTAVFVDYQQLRSRAVYLDYLTSDAQSVIDECFPIEARTADCLAPNASSELELYPFFDLQMTWLARWNNVSNNPSVVTVTNQPIAASKPNTPDGEQPYSRGRAELDDTSTPLRQDIEITSHSGNLGLTATGPIDLNYDADTTTDMLYIDANGSGESGPPIGTVVSGELRSGVKLVPAADLVVSSDEAICGQTDTRWSCVTVGGGFVTVSNYYLSNPTVYVCSDLTYSSQTTGSSVASNTTTFVLPASGEADIWVTDDPAACPR